MEMPQGPRLDVSAPSRFDTAVAHPARVYNVWLGGKDHYAADRHAAHEVMRRSPQVVTGALANRHFLARVVRFLAAERGIRQFIDIGTGLPAPDNTHEAAQRIAPQHFLHLHRLANRLRMSVSPLASHTRTLPNIARHRDHGRSSTARTRASTVVLTPLSTSTRCPRKSTISIRPGAVVTQV